MLPEQIGFGRARGGAVCPAGVIGIVGARNHPVALIGAGRRCLGGPACSCTLVVARQRAIPILVRGYRRDDSIEIVDRILDPCLRNHFLAFEDTAQQQADDYQHDRDLDQSKTAFNRFLAVELGCSHITSVRRSLG